MKYLFRIYQWCIAAPILLVATIITAIVTIIGSYINSDWWGYYPAKWWSRLWCLLLFVRIDVQGRQLIDRNTSYVFVANHQGAFDIFSIYGFLGHPFKWMMRKGLGNFPLVGYACRRAGHIMVDTHSAEGLKKTMADAERKLSNGVSLVVFPEGRRTETGKMGPFKPGAYKLAVEFNLPVVPITIDGSYRVMPRTTFNVTPGKIVLKLHEPIHPSPEGHDIVRLMAQSREAIASDLPGEAATSEA